MTSKVPSKGASLPGGRTTASVTQSSQVEEQTDVKSQPMRESPSEERSFYVDSGRKLDNKVQKAQRIIPGREIKPKYSVSKFNISTLPFANEHEHL